MSDIGGGYGEADLDSQPTSRGDQGSASRARAKRRQRSVQAEARDLLTKALEGEPATIVDLLSTDEGADIEFEPERLGLTVRSAEL